MNKHMAPVQSFISPHAPPFTASYLNPPTSLLTPTYIIPLPLPNTIKNLSSIKIIPSQFPSPTPIVIQNQSKEPLILPSRQPTLAKEPPILPSIPAIPIEEPLILPSTPSTQVIESSIVPSIPSEESTHSPLVTPSTPIPSCQDLVPEHVEKNIDPNQDPTIPSPPSQDPLSSPLPSQDPSSPSTLSQEPLSFPSPSQDPPVTYAPPLDPPFPPIQLIPPPSLYLLGLLTFIHDSSIATKEHLIYTMHSPPSNKGLTSCYPENKYPTLDKMLNKMNYQGKVLGIHEQGTLEPIRVKAHPGSHGRGYISQDTSSKNVGPTNAKSKYASKHTIASAHCSSKSFIAIPPSPSY